MNQYRVMGVDSEDKIMWLTQQEFWGEAKDAGLFSRRRANELVHDQNTRNRYLDRNDRIMASVKGAM